MSIEIPLHWCLVFLLKCVHTPAAVIKQTHQLYYLTKIMWTLEIFIHSLAVRHVSTMTVWIGGYCRQALMWARRPALDLQQRWHLLQSLLLQWNSAASHGLSRSLSDAFSQQLRLLFSIHAAISHAAGPVPPSFPGRSRCSSYVFSGHL